MTTEEAKERYGADATEWLRRWDEGEIVWSVEMGGLGPGYEQAIQITAAEIIRYMIRHNLPRDWEDEAKLKEDQKRIDKAVCATANVQSLGLSGAQWGAALNIASCFMNRGPWVILSDESVQDRKIQVSNHFPVPDVTTP